MRLRYSQAEPLFLSQGATQLKAAVMAEPVAAASLGMRKLGPAISTFEHRRIKPEPKTADPFYLTPEYREWREVVIAKAGRRCEAVERGIRCRKSEHNRPPDRMFADHITEVRDGGAKFDPANGQCLCGRHHTLKTTAVRAARLAGTR